MQLKIYLIVFDLFLFKFSLTYLFLSIVELLKPLPPLFNKKIEPICKISKRSTGNLDGLLDNILKHKLPDEAERTLFKWLSIMSGKEESLDRLGAQISIALQEVCKFY